MTKFQLASSSDWIQPRENSKLDYSSMQDHRDNGVADLGRMLDAGVIPGQ
jgi:hypothetical protein